MLRNIGQYDSVNAGAQILLSKLTLIYGENGRGKTTLSSVLRSLGTGEESLVLERRRLGAARPPHVVLGFAGGVTAQFQHGAWSTRMPHIAIFDDAFVAANVCSGIEIDTDHRQNLHELILGARGVALNAKLKDYVARIEEHNRALTSKGNAIPADARCGLSIDEFCALPPDPDIVASITTAKRNLAAARSANTIRQRARFLPFTLPAFDVDAIDALLTRTLPDIEADAVAQVRAHLRRLGKGGEEWVGNGMSRIAGASERQDHKVCPFCTQNLNTSPLITHYQAYFSQAYADLKSSIIETGKGIKETHGGDVQAAFERSVRIAVQDRTFWSTFTDIPEVEVDTAAVLQAWSAARDAVLTILRAKAASPLEAMTLSVETRALICDYDERRAATATLSRALQDCNTEITVVKEQTANADIAACESNLKRLQAVDVRHSNPVSGLCADYLAEKADKRATENLRTQARAALNNYRKNIFPAYETAINTYLQRFNAGFQLASVSPQNTRGGSSCTYNVVINNVHVALTANAGPAFRNTLSAGDRNTLALAFFFASLERDPQLAHKILVIDDPMTSLDEHRSLTTVQEIRRMQARVSQVIVLSHSKPFLCQLWEGADIAARQALLIQRGEVGSTLAVWDVNHDCITEHDRRHALVQEYLQAANPVAKRCVAAALRCILEAFMRVAYPAAFPPGRLLGPFLGTCQQRAGQQNQILSQPDIDELRALLAYANRFHHDTNAAYETEAINDQELMHFSRRVLTFARRS